MVVGLDRFRAYFADYADSYAIIGGVACDLLFTAAGLPFRATKDVDMVLCVEVVEAGLSERIAAFLDVGGYQARALHDGEKRFYRFDRPRTEGFPAMLELFARAPATLTLPDSDRYVRLPVEDAMISLSALLLDPDYYEALQGARVMVEGVSILNERLLIPFKARAFLDLSQRRANGEDIAAEKIRKHRNDVFRLVQLLPAAGSMRLAGTLRADLQRFIVIVATEDIDPKTFTVPMTKEEGMAELLRFYALSGDDAQ